MIVNGRIMITVRETQYKFAQHLLDRAGLVTGAEPAAPSRARSRRGASPSRSDSLGDLLREIGDIRL
jgi:hypothetical protein